MVQDSSAMRTAALVVGGTIAAGLALYPASLWWEVKKCETPKYTVVKRLTSPPSGLWQQKRVVEIRSYAPYLIAEVTVEGAEDCSKASTIGFKMIAGYIFGANKPDESPSTSEAPKHVLASDLPPEALKVIAGEGAKVAMTSPVGLEMTGDKYTVYFIMPSKYTLSTLPKPKSDKIVIKEVPAHTLAAISWRGASPKEHEVELKRQELTQVLTHEGVRIASPGNVRLYQYYPPMTPPWLRYQEVLVPVELPPPGLEEASANYLDQAGSTAVPSIQAEPLPK